MSAVEAKRFRMFAWDFCNLETTFDTSIVLCNSVLQSYFNRTIRIKPYELQTCKQSCLKTKSIPCPPASFCLNDRFALTTFELHDTLLVLKSSFTTSRY